MLIQLKNVKLLTCMLETHQQTHSFALPNEFPFRSILIIPNKLRSNFAHRHTVNPTLMIKKDVSLSEMDHFIKSDCLRAWYHCLVENPTIRCLPYHYTILLYY